MTKGSPLRFLFFIQGEGRGHLTQALALKGVIEGGGHKVVAAFLGENPGRPSPAFFRNRFQAPLYTYPTPAFVLDKERKGIRPVLSILKEVARFPVFWSNGPRVHRLVTEFRPHLLVSFYDLLGGLYSSLYKPDIPLVGVGHQFLFFHPDFPTGGGTSLEFLGARILTRATAPRAALRLALSFSPLRDLPERRIRVVPPLLRQGVLEGTPSTGQHFLAYILNPGYAQELDRWQAENPEVELHCFWDKQDAPPTLSPRPGLTFHRLDDGRFLELLASSKGFATTAGFESVCEAVFWGKPALLIPTRNNFEQMSNALDAQRAGLANWREDFDLSDLLASAQSSPPNDRAAFNDWVRGAPGMIFPLLEATALRKDPMRVHIQTTLQPSG